MLEYALDYADRGMSVIPVHSVSKKGKCSCGSAKCSSPGKHPRVRWQDKEYKAMTRRSIREWWDKYPDSNIGIVTGEVSGIMVVDIDGKEGMDSLRDRGFEPHTQMTPRVISGGNGLHLYYAYQKLPGVKTRANVLHKVDIRTDGGMIVAPPSVHASGNEYEWVAGFDIVDIQPINLDISWMNEEDDEGRILVLNESKFTKVLRGVSEGNRNETCASLAGHFLSVGLPLDEVMVILENWNEQNDPPMPHRDVEICVHSIARKDSRPDYGSETEIIDGISKILKMKIDRVIRVTGDEPKYELITDKGICRMTVEQLLSPAGFQAAIAKGAGVSINRLKTSGSVNQTRMAGMIMEVAEEQYSGSAATQNGEMLEVLTQYLMLRDPVVCDDKTVPAHDVFRIEDTIWFNLNDFIQWGNTNFHLRISLRDGAQRLRSAGVDQSSFHRVDNKGERKAWGVNANLIGKADTDVED